MYETNKQKLSLLKGAKDEVIASILLYFTIRIGTDVLLLVNGKILFRELLELRQLPR